MYWTETNSDRILPEMTVIYLFLSRYLLLSIGFRDIESMIEVEGIYCCSC